MITNFANNDGWFDDISDGPVSATIVFEYEMEDYKYEKDKQGKAVLAPKDKQPKPAKMQGYTRIVCRRRGHLL